MGTLFKGSIAGGIVAFVWMNISWMVLPWHWATISSIPMDSPVSESLKSNIPEDGLYIYPWTDDQSEEAMQKLNSKMEAGPFVFMAVRPKGLKLNMPLMMLYGFLFNIVVALLLTFLLTKSTGLSLFQKACFVETAAVAGAIVILAPLVIWWHFPLPYILVTLIDTAITWGLAGLAMGKVVKCE